MPLLLWITIGVFSSGVLFALFALWKKKKNQGNYLNQKVWAKFYNWGLTFGLVGLFLTFLKYERVAFLSMRILFAVLVIVCIIWLGFILKFVWREVPKMKEEKRKQAEIKKYLP